MGAVRSEGGNLGKTINHRAGEARVLGDRVENGKANALQGTEIFFLLGSEFYK